MPLSKKLRFDVFKRDSFTCQYCGKRPPEVVLEVDHMEPRCEGGTDDFDNLLTACFDCNRGKGAERLTEAHAPLDLAGNLELLKERKRQADAYADFLAEQRADEDRWIQSITGLYEQAYKGWTLAPRFQNGTVRMFLRKLPAIKVHELFEYAVQRFPKKAERDTALRYFAGCCWKRVNGERND